MDRGHTCVDGHAPDPALLLSLLPPLAAVLVLVLVLRRGGRAVL